MLIENGMLLYHGSYTTVEHIDVKESALGKDFGKGFYLTKNKIQAKQFIKTSLLKAKRKGLISQSQKYGYVNSYKFFIDDLKKIKIYELDKVNNEWLWYIAKNRKGSLVKNINNFINKDIDNSDIIIGKIANDTTNPVITTFLNGLYGNITSENTTKFVIDMLMPEKLDYQYCFKTRGAIKCLDFVEAKRYEI